MPTDEFGPRGSKTPWQDILGRYAGSPVHEGSFVQDNGPATEAITQPFPDVDDRVADGLLPPGPSILQGHKARYELDTSLGQGGSGSVYRAICLDPSRGLPNWVAVKTLVGLDDRISDLTLRRELSSLLALESSRTPKVYDWHIDSEPRFVVMEYFPHGSLNRLLAKVGRLDVPQCWALMQDLLEAIRDAHQASVLHLDIKPGNVLLDTHGRYVLTDFGISQGALMNASSRMPTGVGTRGYQAPEQRWRAPALYDMRTDLYGLGATIWAACTGINLASQKASELWAKTRDEPFGLPPVSRFLQFCPSQFEDVVMALLRQQPRDRPGGAAEVLKMVEEGIKGTTTPHSSPGDVVTPQERREVARSLLDPVWATVFKVEQAGQCMRFAEGTVLAEEGEESYRTYILLTGRVGAFLGEVATLTGRKRTATMKAETEVVAHALNASQLEQLVTGNPAVGIRLIRAMAERLAREADSARARSTPARSCSPRPRPDPSRSA